MARRINFVIKFKNINSVNEANNIIGKFIYADKSVLDNLVSTNSFYIEDRDNPYVGRLRLVTNDPIKPLHTVRVSALPN